MKSTKNMIWFNAVITALIIAVSCTPAVKYPKTFIPGLVSESISIEIPVNLQSDAVWQSAVAVLAQKYSLATISKEAGNIITDWVYSATGKDKTVNDYRVRGLISFASDWTKVNLGTEANYLKNDEWLVGHDTELLGNLQTAINEIIEITK
ncbi:MAG: hypothetical protein KGZ86_08610 [Candidatus Latescibacteria bacterium]|nr:hypothetical protein [Candidatus Latescibacterota bacterium]